MRTALLPPTATAGLAILAAVAFAACGDNGAETPVEEDASTTDVVADTAPDSAVDDVDASGDETDVSDAPPTPEVCDDRVDNDGDGDIDCYDEECDLVCPTPELGAACDDGEDNDLDGDVDCDDYDCVRSELCDPCAEESLRGSDTECPPPWNPGVGDGPFSYVYRVQVPSHEAAACCFDFDGDGVVDIGLAGLVAALGVDADELLTDRIRDDDVAVIFEWDKGSERAGFHAYFATNDVDDDGVPDDDFATRVAGDGTFQLDPASVDEYGAQVQFNRAREDEGVLVAGPSQFHLNVPIHIGDVELELDLTIEQATMFGPLEDTTTGRASVDAEFEIEGEMVEFGGMQLGGVIPLDQVGKLLDSWASECTCAGFDPSMRVISYGDDGVTYNSECVQTPTDGCTEADGPICANLDAVCAFLPTMVSLGLNDLDTNNNGVGDSISVGLWLSLTGATLTDPPFPVEE